MNNQNDMSSGDTAVPDEPVLEELLTALRSRLPDLTVNEAAVEISLAAVSFSTRSLAAVNTHFGRYGLSQARFSILMLLFVHRERTWTPAMLADIHNVSRPTLTGVVKGLEADGWITRSPHPKDGRKTRLMLSPSGESRFRKIIPDHFARIQSAFESIDPEKFIEFRSGMELLLKAFDRLCSIDGEGL